MNACGFSFAFLHKNIFKNTRKKIESLDYAVPSQKKEARAQTATEVEKRKTISDWRECRRAIHFDQWATCWAICGKNRLAHQSSRWTKRCWIRTKKELCVRTLVKLTTALFLGSWVLRVWPQTRYPSHWMGSGAKLVAFKHDSRHVEFTTLLGSA